MDQGIALKEIVTGTAAPAVPLPGSGRTGHRFATLSSWAARDLSLARLAEGHVDALAILAEAGSEAASIDATYGVWAARSGTQGTAAQLRSDGWHLSGRKPFCSGSGVIDRALVTAETEGGYRLFDIALAENVVSSVPNSWEAVGMADSFSETLEFGGPPITPDRAIGGPGFYLDRPGFWFGAVGVAACWYGGAQGLVDGLAPVLGRTPSDVITAEFGHAVAHAQAMHYLIESAANAIDADPTDSKGDARLRALSVRHAVHRGATEVLGHCAAAGGARPLCHDREQAQRTADLYVYLAQHHGPVDALELGRLTLNGVR